MIAGISFKYKLGSWLLQRVFNES